MSATPGEAMPEPALASKPVFLTESQELRESDASAGGRVGDAVSEMEVRDDPSGSLPVSRTERPIGFLSRLTSRQGLATETRCSKHCRTLITFRKDQLLRASSYASVLSGAGKILDPDFNTQSGACDLFEQSRQVDHIDAFISHNWVTGRTTKLLTLSLHFNLAAALACSLAGSVLTMLLVMAEALPCHVSYKIDIDFTEEVQRSIWCKVVGQFIFVLVLFCKHELVYVLTSIAPGLWPLGATVFMDKTCISQTDPDLQKEGIESLGAFLNYSWSMVIVYTDIYLKKLWTVYEVASFLALQPKGRMIVLPTFLWKTVLVGVLTFVFWHLWYHLAGMKAVVDFASLDHKTMLYAHFAIRGLIFTVTGVVFGVMMRYWARVLQQTYADIQNFSIHNTTVFNEDDRSVVYNNIAAFIRTIRTIELEARPASHPNTPKPSRSGTGPAVELATFEEIVRLEVPRIMEMSTGRAGLPYLCCVAIPWIQLHHGCDNLAAWALDGKLESRPMEALMETLRHSVCLPLLLTPLCLACTATMMRKQLQLSRYVGMLYVVSTTGSNFFVTYCAYRALDWLEEAALDGSVLSAVAYCLSLLSLIIAAVYMFMPRYRERRICRKLGDQYDSKRALKGLSMESLEGDREASGHAIHTAESSLSTKPPGVGTELHDDQTCSIDRSNSTYTLDNPSLAMGHYQVDCQADCKVAWSVSSEQPREDMTCASDGSARRETSTPPIPGPR